MRAGGVGDLPAPMASHKRVGLGLEGRMAVDPPASMASHRRVGARGAASAAHGATGAAKQGRGRGKMRRRREERREEVGKSCICGSHLSP